MKIVFLGTPEFAVPILKGLHEKYEILMVISQPNRVKKKGVFIDTPVAACAKELNLPLFQPEKIKDAIDEIIALGADIMVTAAYGQYIPTKLLNGFKERINVHGSILPYHRGGAPIQRALMEGDEYTGVTIMQMAKRLDAGKIYAIEKYKILPEDTSSSLFSKLSIIGRDLLLDTIEDIYDGKNVGEEQNESFMTYSPNILPEEEIIHFDNSSKNIVNQIRGLSSEPGAYIPIGDIKLKVFMAHEVEDTTDSKPGTVLSIKKGITIKTKDSAISLDLVLMPGKKVTTGKDFSNGQKVLSVGDILS